MNSTTVIKIILAISLGSVSMIARSQNTLPLINDGTCDSILDKKKWDNDFAMYSKTSGTYAEFDTHGNLTVFGYYDHKKKNARWYYFTNSICDSICMYRNNKKTGKSYYFKNGEISLITYINEYSSIDTCYNSKRSKSAFLTYQCAMDGCIQSGPLYMCNGILKDFFPFTIAFEKIDELCLKAGGVGKSIKTIE